MASTSSAQPSSAPDYGSAFLHNHFRIELEGNQTGRGEDTHHAVIRDPHPLDKLLRHETITREEWAAGIHLLELAQRGGFLRFATFDLSTPRVDKSSAQSTGMGSREAFRRAVEALPTPLRQPITMIVIEARPVVEWERTAMFRPGSGLGALRVGLQCLAVHFGLMSRQ